MNRLLGKFLRITVFDDIKLRLINPLEYQQKTFLLGKLLEPEVTHTICSVLRPGMTFFDIGANLGYYTLLASKIVGSGGEVHAFEPAPVQFRHLSLNVRINRSKNVRLNNLALAERSGDRELFLSDGWNQGVHSFAKIPGSAHSRLVQCISLDEYVDGTGVAQIDVMKMDVEGAELLVLSGGKRTLAGLHPRVIIFEACDQHARAQGYTTSEVKQLLTESGYRIFRLDSSAQLVEAGLSSAESYANLVALSASADRWHYEALGIDLAKSAGRRTAGT